MWRRALLLALTTASLPSTATLAQSAAPTTIAQPEPTADTTSPATDGSLITPTESLAPAVASPADLTPLEAEACRRLTAEAAIALEVANQPAPPPEKKPPSRAEGAGAVAGSLVGQVAGASVAGPVGAAVGAMVVGKVGQKVVSTAQKALGSDKEEKTAEAVAAAQPLTIPGPPPELLAECRRRSPA